MKTRLPASRRGFALLMAVIFMSVMLTFGLKLGSLGYKQQILASAVTESQYAFYAADTALECALYADQQLNFFAVADYVEGQDPKTMSCGGSDTITVTQSLSSDGLILTSRATIPLDSDTRCADITVYKPPPSSGTTYIFSQGYDVSCERAHPVDMGAPEDRFVSRGIEIHY